MDKCPICLENLDAASPVLPCGHRCHASCLGQLAKANGSAPTRRGAVIACPSCRQESRVAAPPPVAAFGVGDAVLALWGHKWYPGVVDEVLEDGYEIAWDEEDASNEVPAARVRARVQPVPVAAPRNTPEPQAAPARPPSRSLRRDPRCPCGPPPSRSLRDRRCLRRPLRTRMEPKAPAPAKKMRSEAGRERQRAHSKKWKREERERERARKAKKQKRFEELRENYPKQRADDGDADDAPAHTPAPAVETCMETTTPPCRFDCSSMGSHVRRCGGSLSRNGPVRMLDDGAAFACCWRAAASRAQWDAERVTVKLSFIRETLALVDALEDDYPGSLSYGELEKATLLWRVSCSLEDTSLDCVVCSMACKGIIYELRWRCRKVRTLRLRASQSVERSLAPPPTVASV